MLASQGGKLVIANLLKDAGLTGSTSESSTTTVPFTTTYGMPVAGSPACCMVALSVTVSGSNTTTSASAAKRSTILPLPSSPHWVPIITMFGTFYSLSVGF